MIDYQCFDGIATAVADVPDHLLPRLAPIIVDRFEGGTTELFREMDCKLPKTYSVLVDKYARPAIGWKRVGPWPGSNFKEADWLVDLILISELRTLRVAVNHSQEHTQATVDKYRSMFPPAIRAYFFLADGFEFLDPKTGPVRSSHGLPLLYYYRPTLREFLRRRKRNILSVPRSARKKGMFVWMTSKDGQILVVDEVDSELYRWEWRSTGKPIPLDEPEVYWDSHCARVFDTGDVDAPIFA